MIHARVFYTGIHEPTCSATDDSPCSKGNPQLGPSEIPTGRPSAVLYLLHTVALYPDDLNDLEVFLKSPVDVWGDQQVWRAMWYRDRRQKVPFSQPRKRFRVVGNHNKVFA